MSAAWLGLDLGTSSLKGPLVDDDGRVLGRGRGVYPTHRAGVRMEQDARPGTAPCAMSWPTAAGTGAPTGVWKPAVPSSPGR